ncbi:MAG TPA: protein kinase [Bryobacteraceae bacterium]|nr:protein kinase [Bryobacteraceae bacterium]
MIGKTIDHYLILEKLGSGDTNTVWKAQDLRLDRMVVLKAIEVPDHDADALTSFQKETRAGVSLNHPNISSIFDVVEDAAGRYLIYEYQPGGSLRERMQRAVTSGELIPIDRSVDYILNVAQGLAEAHRHGVIHRDVSAENIIVTPTHAVKITNFGKARFGDGPTFAGNGSITGAFGVFVPERLQGQSVDHRGDVYSLCALLFELLTGEKPFRSKNAAAHLQEVMYQPVPRMEEMRPGVSDGLQRIVEKGMAKKPEERYATMDLLVEDLRAELRDGLKQLEPLPEEPAVAVLPVIPVGNDEALAAFCDGLTEEIGYQLQSVVGLQVAATTSAARFKGKTEDLRKVGAQLNVNLLLEGNARAAGNMVRIIMKLTDAGTGYQVWSERFDRDMGNALAVQDELAQTMTRVLRQRVAGETIVEPEPPAASGMTSMFNVATLRTEIPVRPLVMDEVLKAARGLLAPQETLGEAIRTAMKEPANSVDAQVALGYANAVLGKPVGSAEQAFLRALEMDPSRVDALIGLATHVYAAQGRFQEALSVLQRIDPSEIAGVLAMGWVHFWRGDFEAAINHCRLAFKINSGDPEVYLLLGRAYAALGQYREAIIACSRGRVLAPEDPRIAGALSYCYGRSGQADEANRLADELGSLSKQQYVSVLDVAMPYAGLGLGEWVSCCVERAKEEHPAEMLWWERAPEWAPFRAAHA